MNLTDGGGIVPRSALGARYLGRLAGSGTAPAGLAAEAVASDLLAPAYKHRFLPCPVFLSAAETTRLASDLRQVYAMLRSLPERLFGGSRAEMARQVGMTPTQGAAAEQAAGGPELVPLARADLYRSAEGFKLLELNITSALGGFENAHINRAMLAHPVLRDFVAEHRLAYIDTLRAIVDTFYAECASHLGGDRPVVALTDWPESFVSYEPRLHVLAGLLAGWGIDALPCHVGQIAERGGRLEVAGRPVDAVFRFFLIEEIAGEADGKLAEPILRAAARGSVGLFSRMDAELYGNKGALAMLSDDRYRPLFSPEELACVDRLLPWTRHVRRVATDPAGDEVDLLRHARAEQHELILKPTLLHGGTGVVAGWQVTADEWAGLLAAAVDGPYVLQRRVRPSGEPFPALDGTGAEDLFLNWGIFLTDPGATGTDGYGGCIVRGSTDPDVGVVSMANQARVGCCFHETTGSVA